MSSIVLPTASAASGLSFAGTLPAGEHKVGEGAGATAARSIVLPTASAASGLSVAGTLPTGEHKGGEGAGASD